MNAGQIIIFDKEEFLAAYPEQSFLTMTDAQLNNYFELATGILSPIVGKVVCCEQKLKNMLYLLTAHVAFLFSRGAGVTGTLSNATEGTVTAGFAQIPQSLNAAWFNQTQYGSLFWAMAKPYMLGRYIPYVCGCKC